MAHVLRPLIHWTRWRHRHSTFFHLLSLRSSSTHATTKHPSFAIFSTSYRELHSRSRSRSRSGGIELNFAPPPADFIESDEDDESSDSNVLKKSRNERKRESQRAFRWGMELAAFSPLQIKRILRVADLGQEVFDALMVVKTLGRDVREGKRRQYNYIGKLLREAEPKLMDSLIQATKDGDQSVFQHLLGNEIVVDDEDDGEEEIAEEDEEEDSVNSAAVTRWYNGLINKDITITNEIYSLREVEFDRQELRQLVRKVHSTIERESSLEDNRKADAAAVNARRSLTRFLQGLAKQLPPQ